MKLLRASFAREEELVDAVAHVQKHGHRILDLYTPYPVHGLDQVLSWPRSRLPGVCFVCGLVGALAAAWFQYWASATSWPLNVGGRPWNSLPAFVPVIFECMVLLAGYGVVLAFLVRCGLYPGRQPTLHLAGSTNDRFIVVLHEPEQPTAENKLRQLLRDCHAIDVEERTEEARA